MDNCLIVHVVEYLYLLEQLGILLNVRSNTRALP
jgi:hypothetical protein